MFLLELLLISIIHLAMIPLDTIRLCMIIRRPTVIICSRCRRLGRRRGARPSAPRTTHVQNNLENPFWIVPTLRNCRTAVASNCSLIVLVFRPAGNYCIPGGSVSVNLLRDLRVT